MWVFSPGDTTVNCLKWPFKAVDFAFKSPPATRTHTSNIGVLPEEMRQHIVSHHQQSLMRVRMLACWLLEHPSSSLTILWLYTLAICWLLLPSFYMPCIRLTTTADGWDLTVMSQIKVICWWWFYRSHRYNVNGQLGPVPVDLMNSSQRHSAWICFDMDICTSKCTSNTHGYLGPYTVPRLLSWSLPPSPILILQCTSIFFQPHARLVRPSHPINLKKPSLESQRHNILEWFLQLYFFTTLASHLFLFML